MRMGQGVRTGLGHGGITCVLQTQFSSFFRDVSGYKPGISGVCNNHNSVQVSDPVHCDICRAA